MGDSIPSSDAQLDPPRSSLIRCLRMIRKSLEDDGLVGCVTESPFYNTLANLRVTWFALEMILWGLEHYCGKYMMNPVDRMMRDAFKQQDSYGPLGRALNSVAVGYFNRALAFWWGFDVFLGLFYVILEKFTLEEYEVVQREYEDAKKLLGDVGDEEREKDKKGPLDRLVVSRPFQYLVKATIFWNVLSMVGSVGTDVYDGVKSASKGVDMSSVDLSHINPYRRDLPPSQDGVLREVVYMSHVLRDLTPTTLPEDDYELFSNMLQSLATRTDLSWRVYEETDIRGTIMSAANRRGYRKQPIADEPFFINERVEALYKHWHELAIAPGKPERWEDTSDTTFMKPLLHGRSTEGGEQINFKDEGHKLILTPEQSIEADRVYNKWRRSHDRKASYLKDHPPTPIGWVPVPKSNMGIRNAWDTLFEDGVVAAGRHVAVSKLAENQAWKPIFGSFHNIPWKWHTPGETEERSVEYITQDNDASVAEVARQTLRKNRQLEYLEELKVKLEQKEEKQEL